MHLWIFLNIFLQLQNSQTNKTKRTQVCSIILIGILEVKPPLAWDDLATQSGTRRCTLDTGDGEGWCECCGYGNRGSGYPVEEEPPLPTAALLCDRPLFGLWWLQLVTRFGPTKADSPLLLPPTATHQRSVWWYITYWVGWQCWCCGRRTDKE